MDERNYKLLQNSSICSHSLFEVQVASLQIVKTLQKIKDKNFHFYSIFSLYFIFQAAIGLNWSHNACDAPNTKTNFRK